MAYRGDLDARASRIGALLAELDAIREHAKDDRVALARIDAALAPRRASRRWMLAVVIAVLSIAAPLSALHVYDAPPAWHHKAQAAPRVGNLWIDGARLAGTVTRVEGTGATALGDGCRASIERVDELPVLGDPHGRVRGQWSLSVWCGDALLYDDLVSCTPPNGATQICADDLGSSLSASPRAYLDTNVDLLRIEDGPRAAWSVDVRIDAHAVSDSPTFFGDADLNGARTTTLRMTGPVTEIRGTPAPDGFSVVIPGVLAMDRAARMAQDNPAIERAVLMNRGDHAHLTVRFAPGRTPHYHVAARGSAVEVTIGR